MREEGAGGGILPKCVFYIFEISKICNFPYTPECLKWDFLSTTPALCVSNVVNSVFMPIYVTVVCSRVMW